MNKDFRVAVTFRANLKRKRLAARLGPLGVLALIDLWGAAASDRPSGSLEGWSAEDIELAADWSGPPGALVETLVQLKFLDFDEKTICYSIHDWVDWNDYCASEEQRKAAGRAGSSARWAAKTAATCPAQDIVAIYHEVLPHLPPVAKLGPATREKIVARWAEDPGRQSLEWWRSYFSSVAKSDFLGGKTEEGFLAGLNWLVGQENIEKVLNDNYKNRY